MAESIDITALDDFCQEHKAELFGAMLLKGNSQADMTVFPEVADEMVLTDISSGKLIQGWKKTFDPKGDDLVLAPRTLKVRPAKIDLEITPQLLRQSWLGKLMKGKGFTPENFPFEAFLMEYIAAKGAEELELDAIYNGESSWPTVPTDGTELFDGFKKIIEDEVLAGNIVPYVSGAVTASNAYDVVRAMYKNAPLHLRNTTCMMYMSDTTFQNYLDDYAATVGSVIYNKTFDGAEKLAVPGSGGRWKMSVQAAWGDHDGIVVAPPEHMVHGTMMSSDVQNIMLEKDGRSVRVMIDFVYGVQFATLQSVFVNDRY